jgi:serine/threonine protein kinase
MVFALEYASRRDLSYFVYKSDQFRDVAIPETLAWDFAIQMFRSLTFLHTGRMDANAGAPTDWVTIIHHDIKAANILVVDDAACENGYRLIIADFGLAEFYTGPYDKSMRPG